MDLETSTDEQPEITVEREILLSAGENLWIELLIELFNMLPSLAWM